MSPVNLHPEALLDKLDSGELTANEQRTLDEHLKQCLTCRFELQLRSDFQEEALQIYTAPQKIETASVVADADPFPEAAPHPVSASLRPKAPRKRFAVLLTAAALVTVSGAAALVSVHALAPPVPQAPASHSEERPQKAPASASRKPANSPGKASPSAPSLEAQVRVQREPERPQRLTSLAANTQLKSTGASTSTTPASRQDGAAEIFSAANRARRASRPDEAKRLYHRLQEQYPSSSEAQLSLLTLASLQLDTGNAGGALQMFDRYLTRAGRPLEAEALYGRARALRRLNQGAAEARAWRGLLAKYPGSRYAHEAQERLKALSVD